MQPSLRLVTVATGDPKVFEGFGFCKRNVVKMKVGMFEGSGIQGFGLYLLKGVGCSVCGVVFQERLLSCC